MPARAESRLALNQARPGGLLGTRSQLALGSPRPWICRISGKPIRLDSLFTALLSKKALRLRPELPCQLHAVCFCLHAAHSRCLINLCRMSRGRLCILRGAQLHMCLSLLPRPSLPSMLGCCSRSRGKPDPPFLAPDPVRSPLSFPSLRPLFPSWPLSQQSVCLCS